MSFKIDDKGEVWVYRFGPDDWIPPERDDAGVRHDRAPPELVNDPPAVTSVRADSGGRPARPTKRPDRYGGHPVEPSEPRDRYGGQDQAEPEERADEHDGPSRKPKPDRYGGRPLGGDR